MENIYQFTETQILTLALVLMRTASFVVVWPVFGTNTVPNPVKILLALSLAILMYPIARLHLPTAYNFNDNIVWLGMREVAVGLILGFLSRLFFFSISFAGHMIDVATGLSSAQIFNPVLGENGAVMEQFQIALATLFFLFINGHHIFLTGLGDSYRLLPIAIKGISFSEFKNIAGMGQEMLLIGFRMAAPVVVALFITNLAMGIIGRAVPQLNVLLTSVSVTVLLGLMVMFITMPLFASEMNQLMMHAANRLFGVLRAL